MGAVPFFYDLSRDRIAQRPVVPYDAARLLAADRGSGDLTDSIFKDICSFLTPGDVLVFNDSRVVKARLFGTLGKSGARIEILLLEQQADPQLWKIMARPGRKFLPGLQLCFGKELAAEILERVSDREFLIRFSAPAGGNTADLLEQKGLMPIPPYIRSGVADSQDVKDYQTCFAKIKGSVAAPTAGLHFTKELCGKIAAYGCSLEYLTLHVGKASFMQLWQQGREDEIIPPESERYIYSKNLLERIESARRDGKRVMAVGTTVVRALESMAQGSKGNSEGDMIDTDLFITPGYKFKMVDALITNFHQPATTHMLLVEAFMGRELLEKTYRYALNNGYRFLSYGDGMVIV